MKNDALTTALNIHFTPLLPLPWLIAACAAAALLFAFALLQKSRGKLFRAACAALFILALTGASLVQEQRAPVPDVAAIIVDKSASQNFGDRAKTTQAALDYLKTKLQNVPGLDLRIIEAPQEGASAPDTKLFGALDRALSDVPKQRRAGVIFLTDGEIHDVPKNPADYAQYGPVHVLLTGLKNEKDRRIKIIEAEAYGIVGKNVTVRYMVEDSGDIDPSEATVTLDAHDGQPRTFTVPTNEIQTAEIPVTQPGQNVFELRAAPLDGELTLANNRAAFIVNGVRDRLRALLISAQPYEGARTWRDLLTSDPGVDLVHFTILRDPQKIDATPPNELSLIPFPFEELFETKLHDFDLVIFDRYRFNGILPPNYLENVEQYVQGGGAFLATAGPDAGPESLYNTPLKTILPATPTGEIVRKPFTTTLTDAGKKHPVTRGLDSTAWGPWLRQVSMDAAPDSEVLINGADGKPLLILSRTGKGRSAQIASDQIWLWARGYEGGGPYSELMRRLVHWLMKEPELDEKALDVKVSGDEITLRSQDYQRKTIDVTMTKPDDATEKITLEQGADGTLEKTIKAPIPGIYGFDDAGAPDAAAGRRFAIVGELSPPELAAVRTTPDLMAPIVKASGGGTFWLSETPQPGINFLPPGRSFAGNNWLALRQNGDYAVKGVEDKPLLPPWLAAILLIGFAALMWRREGEI